MTENQRGHQRECVHSHVVLHVCIDDGPGPRRHDSAIPQASIAEITRARGVRWVSIIIETVRRFDVADNWISAPPTIKKLERKSRNGCEINQQTKD